MTCKPWDGQASHTMHTLSGDWGVSAGFGGAYIVRVGCKHCSWQTTFRYEFFQDVPKEWQHLV